MKELYVFDLSRTFSRIRVRGASRVDFLHRMSTGNLMSIKPGEGRTTVFTTPIGRMVDHAVVLASEDSLLMLAGPEPDKLARWLRKYIFFNDDVQLADETDKTMMSGIFGDGAVMVVDHLCTGAGQLARYAHVPIADGLLISAPPLLGAGFYVIGTRPVFSDPIDPLDAYEDLRIRAGYPAAPNEINTEYIPLEAGLNSTISFTKGCYIGQEIIARMESRGQLAKRLVKVVSDGIMQAGDSVRVDGKPAGVLTSVTGEGNAALGYVRSSYAVGGQLLMVGADNVPAHIAGIAGM